MRPSSRTLAVESHTGSAITEWLEAAAELRIRVFREFPYLYDGDMAYEADYLARFARAPGALLVLARSEDTVIGCATAMAMAGADPEFQRPFIECGMRLDSIFYFGESVLDANWRGRGIGHRFFDEREAQAERHGATLMTFCAVERPTDHPLRPAGYRPLDGFWHKRGYQRRDDLGTEFSWKDIDQPEPSAKTMRFWLRQAL
jgi:GNAT superfamily N-acetyltransferase